MDNSQSITLNHESGQNTRIGKYTGSLDEAHRFEEVGD